MQLASYRHVLTQKNKISTLCLDRFYLLANFSDIVLYTLTLLYAFYCSAPLLCAGREAPTPDPCLGIWRISFLRCNRVRGSGRQLVMLVLLPGQVFPRTCCYCSWCMYWCLCMVCKGLTLAGVCAGCHRCTSRAPAQPALRPWCASEGSRCGRSCLRHFCQHLLWKFPCVCGSLSVGDVWALAPGLERRGVCVLFLDAGGRPLPIPHVPWDVVVHRSWAAHHVRNFGQVARVDVL